MHSSWPRTWMCQKSAAKIALCAGDNGSVVAGSCIFRKKMLSSSTHSASLAKDARAAQEITSPRPQFICIPNHGGFDSLIVVESELQTFQLLRYCESAFGFADSSACR